MIGAICQPVAGPVTLPQVNGGAAASSIMALFASGELGGLYDPADYLVAAWQDSAGTLPCTALGQTVAILLDKKYGYARGASMMPALSTAVLDTGVTLAASNTIVRFTASAANTKAAFVPVTPTINSMFYEVFFTVSNYVAGNARVRVFGTGEVAVAYTAGVTANGTYRAVIDPVSGGGGVNQMIQIEGVGVSNTFDVSDIRVLELPGNHAWTATAGARPVVQQDAAGRTYLQGDGTDDMIQSQALSGALGYPLWVGCAAKADADAAGAPISIWGGAPPYYEIQKRTTANSWNAFVRGAANASNNETVGTNATAHVLLAEFTATTVNLRMDATDATAATAQANAFGTVTELRICGGGGGFFNGRFYGGLARFGALTADQRTAVEKWLASKAGVTI